MNKTQIEWVKNPDGTQGMTWNPITGCLNGCEYCYARKLANGWLRARYLANHHYAPFISEEQYMKQRLDPFYPRFWENRLRELQQLNIALIEQREVRKPRGIFVCDMSDLFGIGIPEEWTEAILNEIDNKFDRFYLLTKQPQNLTKFSPFPDNCWVGITVTKPRFLIPALDALDSIQCSVRYLSIEPMLAAFNVPDLSLLLAGSVDGLILGAQTNPTVYPKDQWVREIEDACDKAGIPVFEKNNLYPKGFSHLLRQEMPK